MNSIGRLTLLTAFAVVAFYLPFNLNAPLKWFEVFFHEISHGLTAMLTGGMISRIDLQFSGSGTCWRSGGWDIPVVFMGYAGASLWGTLIYMSAATTSKKGARIIAVALLVTLLTATLFWIRDIESLVVMTVMSGILALTLRYGENSAIKYFIELIGIYILISSIQSPTFLLDGDNQGDGASLATLTLVPEFIWVMLWVGLGTFLIGWLYYVTYRNAQNTYAGS